MVLLHDIVEIFTVAEDDGRLVSPIVLGDRCRVRSALIDRDLLWQPLGANGLAQESLGRVPIACGREEKINRVALFVAA